MVIMVLTFILGAAFGIIGLISTDGVSVIQYVFSTENLRSSTPKVIKNANSAAYLDVCLNGKKFNKKLNKILGDGDLGKRIFKTDTSYTQYLDRLYNVSYSLVSTMNTINANKNSLAIQNINAQLDLMKMNIILTTDTSLGADAILNQFLDWNSYSDSSSSNTKQKSCSTYTKDYWVSDSSTCPASYNIAAAGSTADGNSNNCLVLSQWSSAQVSSRYSSAPSGCTATSDFSSIANAAISYFNAMKNYSLENTNLISELEAQNDDLNNAFTSMAEKLVSSISRIQGIINPLVELFKNLVGNNGLFSLIQCGKQDKI